MVLRFLIHLGFAYRRGDKLIIDLLKFESFPSFETIRRTRQIIQNNENLYIPDQEVKEKREKAQIESKIKYRDMGKSDVNNFKNSNLIWDDNLIW